MSYIVPPAPISREEFNRRYAEGARTWRELDPQLAQWYDQRRLQHKIQFWVIGIGVLLLVILMGVVMWMH